MKDLSKCPFCGEPPQTYGRYCTGSNSCHEFESWEIPGPYCDCLEDSCDEKIWNTRPLEDALQAEIVELNRKLEKIIEFEVYDKFGEYKKLKDKVIIKNILGSGEGSYMNRKCTKCGKKE